MGRLAVFDISYCQMVESITIDELDRQLVHALALDGRAGFSAIAEVLGVSDQTVARRYRRLRAHNVLRVVGLADPRRSADHRWWLRITCAPGATLAIAESLARRPDTSWVHLVSGGTEVLCAVRASDLNERDALLLDKLPRTGRIIAVTAHSMLHMFQGGSSGIGILEVLTEDQVVRLRPPSATTPEGEAAQPLDDRDLLLLGVLARDGRAGFADLAAATGWSESTVRRRLDHLRQTGAVYFDLEVDGAALGFPIQAWLWMSVPPSELAAVGAALAQLPEIAFAAATTGPTSLAAVVVCRDSAALYSLITGRISTLTAIRHLEMAPIIRTIKQASHLMPGVARLG